MDPVLHTNIRIERARLGLTQAELAERAGVTRKSINAIEMGRMVPSVVLALRLAQALSLRVEDLFHLDGGPAEAKPGLGV